MKVSVMMASGDVDEWEDAADAIDDRGSLVVLYYTEDEIPEGMKTMEVSREFQEEPGEWNGRMHVPTPMVKTQTFQVAAQYAPGMWMKVEFE